MAETRANDILSAREAEVAAFYVDGLSYKEIARALGISPGTVRTHLNAIYRKLEVSSRTELTQRLAPPKDEPSAPREPVALKLPSEPTRRQLTFIFADIVGSTELAARLDAEDMHELLSAFRREVRHVLQEHGGHAAGFPGDGAIAVFGWPNAVEDGPSQAASAALEIAETAGRLRAADGSAISVRVGVATGLVVVEGIEGRPEDFVGTALNLAARLQAAASPGDVFISDLTRRLIGGRFATDTLDPLDLRGFQDPVPAHHLLRELEHVTRFAARESARVTASLLAREKELESLRASWIEAASGRGGAMLLVGEAGIGKSRLAETLAQAAVSEGAVLVRLQAVEGRDASPLRPVRDAIAAAAGLDPDGPDRERRKALDAWLAEAATDAALSRVLIADLLDLAPKEELPALSPSRRRSLLLDALTYLATGLSRRAPLLLLLEDLHWADPTTLDLAHRLADEAQRAPILMLATTRPEGVGALEALAAQRLNLEPLDAPDAQRLVRERAGDVSLSDEVVEEIVARTDGVPLFIEETTSAVLDGAVGTDVVPASLRETLAARLDRLGDGRRTAQIASAIGRDVDLDLLAAVSEGDGTEADIQRLVDAGLANRRPGGFTFSHALVQDAAYQSMMRGGRRDLHAKIAEAMLGRFRRRFAGDPDVLALHLERAGRTSASIDYYLRAADAAAGRAAIREAEGFARRALDLAAIMEGGAERDRREIAALLALGRILSTRVGYGREEAVAPLRRALELSQDAGLERTEFPIVVALTAQAGLSGDCGRGLQLAERAAILADRSSDASHRVMSAYAMGMTRCWRGERSASAAAFRAGSDAYEEGMHAGLLAMAPHDSGIVCLSRGAVNAYLVDGHPEVFALMNRALELAQRLGHAHSLNYALHWKTSLAIEAGDRPLAEVAMRETVELAEKQDFATWRSMGALSAARIASATGSPKEALAQARHALTLLPQGGNVVCVSYAKGLAGDAMRRLGRKAEAMALLREAVDDAEAQGARWGLVETLRAVARCRLDVEGGDASGAEAVLTRAVALARRQGSFVLEARAAADLSELFLQQGDAEAAARVLFPILRSPLSKTRTAELLKVEDLALEAAPSQASAATETRSDSSK